MKEKIFNFLSTQKLLRDLRIAPNGRLALLASLGKKLSVISMESNNTVLSFDLPAAAWSCSWDLSSSHYVYTGLQNGKLLVFDMRQTLRPVELFDGLTCNPIHTVLSLLPDLTLPSGVRSLLTASSVGLCHWNFGGNEERPSLVPESENQGVCIALAYCPSSNHVVASFRPKVEMSGDMAVSQPSLTPATSLMGQGRLKSQKHPVRDVKYAHDLSSGLLSCLSEDKLQLFLKEQRSGPQCCI
ncbi:transducin/WD40 repeat-like superfamily protein [Actinidia rufa]|uniref:RING-type E3 ubiquitin transferase n=1 Tax=Actinidia rufa TaxID=165716 RepID=A0A7J0DZ25_9ERIC|nr:transducin/WD40 repeat-like superfamily protein [Actinidia rufa]